MEDDMQSNETDKIKVDYIAKRCIHSRKCVLGLPNVFKPGVKGGWILAENADVEELVDVIKSCPSGALTFERLDNGRVETHDSIPTVRLWENGPIEIRADISMSDDATKSRALLCRCGKSKNKPYCDNSHIDADFKATADPKSLKGEAVEDLLGKPLNIAEAPNGPIILEGPVEIIASSGRSLAKHNKTALCRCGASKNKPYCDGSHAKIDFITAN